MNPWIHRALIVLVAMCLMACQVSRKTTTEKTPVEQVLMSRSATMNIRSTEFEGFEDKSFAIDASELVSEYRDTIVSILRQHLLESGMTEAHSEESADLRVYARADYSGIDDSDVFVGIPSVPVPIPGSGTLATPELALYKRISQLGRNKLVFYGVRNSDGSVSFVAEPDPGQRHYVRYTLLLFISFRTTNLDKPF